MGYHVAILRTANGSPVPIHLDEAKAAALNIGWRFDEEKAAFVKESGSDVLVLWFHDGELWTKNPDERGLRSMLELADPLGARVRGDEYETYSSPDTTFRHPDDEPLKRAASAKSRRMIWRDPSSPAWMRIYIVGFFALLGLIGYVVGSWLESR